MRNPLVGGRVGWPKKHILGDFGGQKPISGVRSRARSARARARARSARAHVPGRPWAAHGIILAPFWHNIGMTLGSFWDNLEIILRSFCILRPF